MREQSIDIKGLARNTEVPAGPGHTPPRNAGFPQQLEPPGQEAVLFGLRHGSVLRGRDKSQNVTLVLGLHMPRTLDQ